ncbi:MAG: N-acetylmuramoyl-L-alanine amidase [Candidatus Bipolaricaulota bacterium]|nr:N-acetylmuramoyl-L-alanine amidase [Candidatus Bipolaricaulota bacterium]
MRSRRPSSRRRAPRIGESRRKAQRSTIPAASTLVGFITTPEERAKLTDPTYQESIARGVLQGVANYVAAAGVTPVSTTQTIPLGKGQTAKSTGTTP